MCASNQRNGIWKADVNVFTYKKAYMQVDFGADATGGVVALFDDEVVYANNYDHWWNYGNDNW